MKKVFETSIYFLQVLDPEANIDTELMPKLEDKDLLQMYRYMVLARAFDDKVLSLQRQGRAVTYAPLRGQEAVQVGSTYAMREGDYLVPNYRQHASILMRGIPMDKYLLYWRGFEEGNMFPRESRTLPLVVPVATQIPHAAGLAFALKVRETKSAVLTYVGDGGTSEGDFYEGINFAGAMSLPLVVVIENNQYAISTPRWVQTASETLAQKAVAAGIRGVQVDGNDVLAVYKATREALERSGEGPTLIEAITYRQGPHTTSDNPDLYRGKEELEAWVKKDPIERFRRFLVSKGLWDQAKEEALLKEVSAQVNEAVAKAEKFFPDPRSMFGVFSFTPPLLQEQEEEISPTWGARE